MLLALNTVPDRPWLLLGNPAPPAFSQPPKGPVSFINDVAPILKENCFACHDARKKSGKLDITTFEKLMAGGANGEPVTPGKPQESDLHELIVSTDERRMPPRDKGEAVPPAKAMAAAARKTLINADRRRKRSARFSEVLISGLASCTFSSR